MKSGIQQVLVLAGALLTVALPAVAQPKAATPVAAASSATAGQKPSSQRLQMICMAADLDHDGRITLDEFHRDITRAWHALPQDAAGFVSMAELGAVPGLPRRMIERLKLADRDQDGKLSFKEVVAARMAYFDAADANGDDAMTLQECVNHERKLAASGLR